MIREKELLAFLRVCFAILAVFGFGCWQNSVSAGVFAFCTFIVLDEWIMRR